ncbi:MAG: pentapeptide repeat-containing protein [Cyanobacteria bacterium J06576_12]
MLLEFSHQNLQGKKFSGQDLTGADFSFSNIRGAKFTGANLQNARFTHVVAGQQRRWVIGLAMGLLLLAAIAGFIAAYAGGLIGSLVVANNPELFGPRPVSLSSSLVAILVLIGFIYIAIKQGLGAALCVFLTGIMGIVAIVAAGSTVDALAAVFVLQAIALSIAVASAIMSAFVFSMGRITVGDAFVYAIVVVTAAAAILGGIEGTSSISRTSFALSDTIALTLSGAIAIALLGLGYYMSHQAKNDNSRYVLIQSLAISVSALGGTSFRDTNLTDAIFDEANLKTTDLRGAELMCTSFLNVKGLHQARVGSTYLSHQKIRQLVISRDAQNKDFSCQNLKGINLQGANLTGVDFTGADLSSSNLQQADLSNAKLARAQLYQCVALELFYFQKLMVLVVRLN